MLVLYLLIYKGPSSQFVGVAIQVLYLAFEEALNKHEQNHEKEGDSLFESIHKDLEDYVEEEDHELESISSEDELKISILKASKCRKKI